MRMDKRQAERKIEQLRSEIRHHDHLYYVLDKPTISDQAYDKLFRELEDLEKDFPGLITADSPTQRVGGEPSDKFTTITHKTPLLSLDNVMNEEELISFDHRVEIGEIHRLFTATSRMPQIGISKADEQESQEKSQAQAFHNQEVVSPLL